MNEQNETETRPKDMMMVISEDMAGDLHRDYFYSAAPSCPRHPTPNETVAFYLHHDLRILREWRWIVEGG